MARTIRVPLPELWGVDMLSDAKSVLTEMVVGFLWPINTPLEWGVENISTWRGNEWVKAFEVFAVFIALSVFYIEFQIDRPKDRAVRIATLIAQMAQTHALPNKEGLQALRPTILALVGEGISIEEQNLTDVDLNGADLSNAKLRYSNLSGAGVGPENSCSIPEVVVMQSPDCRELDDLA